MLEALRDAVRATPRGVLLVLDARHAWPPGPVVGVQPPPGDGGCVPATWVGPLGADDDLDALGAWVRGGGGTPLPPALAERSLPSVPAAQPAAPGRG